MSVREARYTFGRALAEEDGTWEEAEQHLRLALEEPGDVPADWEVRQSLARLRERRGDHAGALRNLVRAVICAPDDAVDVPAKAALALLRTSDGRAAAFRLGEQFVKDLNEKGSAASGTSVPRLAAKLALLRNDLPTAESIVQGASPQHTYELLADDADEPEELVAAGRAARVNQLLRDGAAAEALRVVESLRASEGIAGGELASLHALALFANEDAEGALDALREAGDDPLAPAVAALTKLGLAAGSYGPERDQWLDEALSDAATAARLDPRSAELLLLRAQVLIEAGLEYDHGRELLRKGHARLYGRVADVLWYAVERQVRADDFFACFEAEVAAVEEDRERLKELGVRLPSETLGEVHASALWSRVAEAWEPDDPERAQQAFLAAGEAVRGSDPEAALAAAERAYAILPGPSAAVSLVELLWASTFPTRVGVRSDAATRLDRARDLLDRHDRAVPEEEVGRASLLRGLLEMRRQEVLPDPASDLWPALPSLVLGAALMPWNGYAAAHVSTCLQHLDLAAAALRLAVRAHDLAPGDPWVDERLVVTQVNWAGSLDDEGRHLLSQAEDRTWREAVELVDALLADRPRAVDVAPDAEATETWAVEAYAYAALLTRGPEAARPLLERFATAAEESGETKAALEAALLLGNSTEEVEAGAAQLGPAHRALPSAAALLLRTDGAEGGDELVEALGATRRPYHLRNAVRFLRGLAAAHARRPGVAAALRTVLLRADALVENLDTTPDLEVDADLVDAERRGDPLVGATLRLLGLLVDSFDDSDDPVEQARRRHEAELLAHPAAGLPDACARPLTLWVARSAEPSGEAVAEST